MRPGLSDRLVCPAAPAARILRAGAAVVAGLAAMGGLGGCHILGIAEVPCEVGAAHCPDGLVCEPSPGETRGVCRPEGTGDGPGPGESCDEPPPFAGWAEVTPGLAKVEQNLDDDPPFALAFPFDRGPAGADLGDALTFSRGERVRGTHYENADPGQGSIVVWVSLLASLDEDAGPSWLFSLSGLTVALAAGGDLIVEVADVGPFTFPAVASSWALGEPHLLVLRWDSRQPVDDIHHLLVHVDNAVYREQTEAWTAPAPAALQVVGARDEGCRESAGAALAGLTVYRRVLYDGSWGVDLGRGSEVGQIWDDGDGGDPVAFTGSWDVVFALPGDRRTLRLDDDSLEGGAAEAWSHPVLADLLEGQGHLEREDVLGGELWEVTDEAGVAAIPPADQLEGGGVALSFDDPSAGAFVALRPVPGDDLVARALVHSPGAGVPNLMLVDPEAGVELTQVAGSAGTRRDRPEELVLTFEVPDGVRLVHLYLQDAAGSAAPVMWHHVEVFANLLDNPSLERTETAAGCNCTVPAGWSADSDVIGTAATPDSHTGAAALLIDNPQANRSSHVRVEPALEEARHYNVGAMFRFVAGSDEPAIHITNGSLFSNGAELQFNNDAKFRTVGTDEPDRWQHLTGVGWRLRNTSLNSQNDLIRFGGFRGPAHLIVDDAYLFALRRVPLTAGPASAAASVGPDGLLRVDEGDEVTGEVDVTASGGEVSYTLTWGPEDAGDLTCEDRWTMFLLTSPVSPQDDFVRVDAEHWGDGRRHLRLVHEEDNNYHDEFLNEALPPAGEPFVLTVRWSLPGEMEVLLDGESLEAFSVDQPFGDAPTRLVVAPEHEEGRCEVFIGPAP